MAIKLKPLDAQVIVITGASSGIGLVTARMAAKRGAKLFLIARGEDALKSIVAGIEREGGTAAYAAADVTDAGAVRAAADAAVAKFGRIDTWVNNAGVAIYAKLLDTPEDEHQRLFQTNYFGMVHGVRAAMPHLREEGGALITVGSVASDIPSPIMGAYAASKHAVKAYIESLRIEAAADKLPVSITLIKPAGIDTPIAEHSANHLEGEAMIPPPVYAPELVAETILDAATRPRREVTVGGIGRMQVLMAEHFPWLLELLSGVMPESLHAPDIPKTEADNLDAPFEGSRENSRHQPGRSFSVYTAAGRAPGWVKGAAAVALFGGLLALASSSRKASGKGD